MSNIIELTDVNFNTEVLEREGLVLVDFWAAWCGPCKAVAPHLVEIADEVEDVCVGKMEVDANPATPVKFGIRSIPTLIIFKKGEVVDTISGALSKAKIIEFINSARD